MVALPQSIPMSGDARLGSPKDPNGLAIDDRGTLYIPDGQSGSIAIVGRDRRSQVLAIEADGVISSNPIGGVAITGDGTLYVTRHGYGKRGAVMRVGRDGSADEIASLSPAMFRFGVTYDPLMHALYTTQYVKTPHGPAEGAVVEIDLDTGKATTLVVGFTQPVGIVKLGGVFVVTDAKARTVYRIDLREGRAEACIALAELDRPGSVCARGRDSVLVTSWDDVSQRGSVHELWLDGRMRTFATGPWLPRGIVTDGERVFVAVRGTGKILELPLEPTIIGL